MVLSTHAIVGAAIASLMPQHPALAFVCGIASHFAIDAIPHSDYRLRSISVSRRSRSAITLNLSLVRDLALLTFDAAVGLAVAVWLYVAPGSALAVLLGATGAMLPDPLQVAYRLYPKEPLRTLQRFHRYIHSNRKLRSPLAVSSQLLFVLLTIAVTEALRGMWA